ncbi:hypothetical protein AKI39_01310 [Bordetella sp. H567]|uniref:hypothetical protein n=1 Tax=Bordetella sp. H567 TaxID=1697043 RepID=UPI00081CD45F|nr:hypothetical protein [Bordetella sp. H567]AOB29610.1 hypothetical protein AKI39_01310 [Bordetella sp. H567]
MHIGSSFLPHVPAWPLIPDPARATLSDDGSVATLMASVGARVANPEPGQKAALPQHLWVENAPTASEAAYRWLEGMVDVLKEHGAYNIAIDNYRAIYPQASHRDAEKMFAIDLVRAMVDPVPARFLSSAHGSDHAPARSRAADDYRWRRVMNVLKDSGAYAAGLAHYQVYRVQRLAQACKSWTVFFKSRGMDDASIEKFLPERPRLMSWEKANSTFTGQLMRVGDPRHLSGHLNKIQHPAPRLGYRYA